MNAVNTSKNYPTMTGEQLINSYYNFIITEAPKTINAYVKEKKIFWMDSYDKDAVLSDVLVKVLTKGSQFDPSKGSFKTWLNRIIVTTLIDYVKVYKYGEPIYYTDDSGVDVERPDLSIGMENSPEEEFVAQQLLDNLDRFLEARGDVDRDIMTRIISGYKPNEIAEELHMTPNAVSGRLFKMRNAFEAYNKAS